VTESELETESDENESGVDESDPDAPQSAEQEAGEQGIRFVLVPVPREHVLEVMRWVLFRAPQTEAKGAGHDAARVRNLLEQIDEPTKAFLMYLAKAVLEGDDLKLTDAAEDLDQDPSWVTNAVRVINQHAAGGGRVASVRTENAVGITGHTGKISFVTMRPDIARLVRAAAKRAGVDDA
jgi:hypothetical protein